MRAARFFILLFLCALPLAAQIQAGHIYLLKGASGRYLSATPAGGVALSPNTAAWEQWEARAESGELRLVSFHGTELVVDRNGKVFHAPPSGTPNYLSAGVARVFESTAIQIIGGIANMPLVVWDLGTQVTGGLGHNPPGREERWTPVEVPTPAPGRKPLMWAVDTSFYLRSVHNTYLYRARDNTVVQVSSKPYYRWNPFTLWTGSWPLHYGDVVTIAIQTDSGATAYTNFGGNEAAPVLNVTNPYNAKWIIVDPQGQRAVGDRIGRGDVVALKESSSGRYLSCPEGGGRPYLSPNQSPAAWEMWTFAF